MSGLLLGRCASASSELHRSRRRKRFRESLYRLRGNRRSFGRRLLASLTVRVLLGAGCFGGREWEGPKIMGSK
jgi:hypothetical protein